jgi:uncharacterized protein YqgC (DUF456 family)
MTELLLISLVIALVGLVGTVVPGLPGMPLVMGGIALYAIGSGFSVIGVPQFILLMLLGLLGMGLNLLGQIVGAQRFGASRIGLLGAIVGLVIGLFTLGPFGIVLGPLIGAVVAELLKGRAAREAFRSGIGVVVGYICGSVAEVLIALMMIGWFLWSTWGVLTGGPPPRGV